MAVFVVAKRFRLHPELLQSPVQPLVPSFNCTVVIFRPRSIRLPLGRAVYIVIVRYYTFPNTKTVHQVIQKHRHVRVRSSRTRNGYPHNLTPALDIPTSYRTAAWFIL